MQTKAASKKGTLYFECHADESAGAAGDLLEEQLNEQEVSLVVPGRLKLDIGCPG